MAREGGKGAEAGRAGERAQRAAPTGHRQRSRHPTADTETRGAGLLPLGSTAANRAAGSTEAAPPPELARGAAVPRCTLPWCGSKGASP